MKTRIALLPLVLLLPLGCRGENVPVGPGEPMRPPLPCWSATTSEDYSEQSYPCAEHDYACVVERIIEGLIQLKARFPQLAELDYTCVSGGWSFSGDDGLQSTTSRYGVQVDYEHGVSYVANPEYPKGGKVSRELPVLDESQGVMLQLVLSLGQPQMQQALPHPVPGIGELATLNFSRIPDRELARAIRAVIDRERALYEYTHWSVVTMNQNNQDRDAPVRQ